MKKITAEEMVAALERGIKVRNRYFIDESDPKSSLRQGASEAEMDRLENLLGLSLPQSYRMFLCISNGWDFVDAHVSLLSCSEVREGFESGEFAEWYADMCKFGLDYPSAVLVIGNSDITEAKYLLVLPEETAIDDAQSGSLKEWPVIYLSESTDLTYESFCDFLKESEQTYKDLVASENL